MTERAVVLEALSVLCNNEVTSYQSKRSREADISSVPLTVHGLLPLFGGGCPESSQTHIIDEEEFLDPHYDYDFTDLKDTETYYRGGEVYERPCGWKRFALKVLDKYPDGNAWLGERGYWTTTQSNSGEWPVSYHGTSKKSAHGIIVAQYEPGSGQCYGRGIYSTPYISEAIHYTKTFTSVSTGKEYQVVLQNRVNPEYMEKHNNGKYWLVPIPEGLSKKQEQEIIEKAIRPYALLLKKKCKVVNNCFN